MYRALFTLAIIAVCFVQTAGAKPQMTVAIGVNPFQGITFSGSVEAKRFLNGIIEAEAISGFWIDDGDDNKVEEDVSGMPLDDVPIGYSGTTYHDYRWSDIYGGVRFSVGKIREVIPFWLRIGAGLTYHYAWPANDYRDYKFSDGVGQLRPLLFMQGRIKAGSTGFFTIEPEVILDRGSYGHRQFLDHDSASLKSYYFDESVFMLKFGYRFDI